MLTAHPNTPQDHRPPQPQNTTPKQTLQQTCSSPTLPQELIDYIFLLYADPTALRFFPFICSPYLKKKLACKNVSNRFHNCTPMCRVLAVQFYRKTETQFRACLEAYNRLKGRAVEGE
ncbi:hypothetical protein HK097_002964, partial [Rhizophlyctis rosea]